MDLLEYQGKQLFAEHGVPVPDGRPADTVQAAVEAAEEIGYPCVIKAQVRIGKRGKAGGIKIANDRDEALKHSEAIIGMERFAPPTMCVRSTVMSRRQASSRSGSTRPNGVSGSCSSPRSGTELNDKRQGLLTNPRTSAAISSAAVSRAKCPASRM